MYGVKPLEDFKNLITPAEYESCVRHKKAKPTWYSLTVDVFVAYLYRVCNFLIFIPLDFI
jgi:hypothetical protein